VNKIILSIILLFNITIANSGAYYNYRNIEQPQKHFTLDLVNQGFTYIDVSESADICGNKSEYECFNHTQLSFYFPKNDRGLKEGSEWSVDSHNYRIAKIANSYTWEEEKTYFIEKKIQQSKHLYVYSSFRGLIAYSLYEDEKINTYILNGVCGFLSKSSCFDMLSANDEVMN